MSRISRKELSALLWDTILLVVSPNMDRFNKIDHRLARIESIKGEKLELRASLNRLKSVIAAREDQ